jgi:hypothetical protein
MRRWIVGDGVPPMDGPERHQTLQQTNPPTGNLDVLEGDTIPQPIEVVHQRLILSALARPMFPHALLATPEGVIETFPDHMHEGDVVLDNEVDLDSPLNIPGYTRPEYPSVTPVINPDTAARAALNDVRLRPRPHVVAYGRTTNPAIPEAQDTLAAAQLFIDVNRPLATKKFGLIGAYDGDAVSIGRVVVDSTWHHWFSYNLHGFVESTPDTQYQLMQTYYRNVALWLATPAQRQSILTAMAWGTVVADPMAFPLLPARTLWAVGERVVGIISRTVSLSMLVDFVGSFFPRGADQVFRVPYAVDSSEPFTGSIPIDLALRAIIGGIASALIQPAYEYLGMGPRRLLNAGAITRHATEGVKEGQVALIESIKSSVIAATALVGRVERSFQPAPPDPLPIRLIRLRVVAELLQFPDPSDPDLALGHRGRGQDGSTPLSITLRIAIASSVIADTPIDQLEIPRFQPEGGFVDINRVLFEGVVQSGESLTVEVVTGAAGRARVDPGRMRFTDTLGGNPSTWLGPHIPIRSQPWRLWYRIDEVDH